MRGVLLDLTGHTFGRLIVLRRVPNRVHGTAPRWACQCSCGALHEVDGGSLRRGNCRSCGCLQRESAYQHGLTKHPLYHCWYNMNDRCYDPTNKQWDDYGGRGITVCDEWRYPKGLAQFIADMGECPPGHSIERIDNDGNYCKTNCRWATRKQQQRNRRDSCIITYNGRSGTISDWAGWLGVSANTILYRLKTGKPISVVLSSAKFATYDRQKHQKVPVS